MIWKADNEAFPNTRDFSGLRPGSYIFFSFIYEYKLCIHIANDSLIYFAFVYEYKLCIHIAIDFKLSIW